MIYGFLKNEMKYYHRVEASAYENQMQSILAFFNTPNSAVTYVGVLLIVKYGEQG